MVASVCKTIRSRVPCNRSSLDSAMDSVLLCYDHIRLAQVLWESHRSIDERGSRFVPRVGKFFGRLGHSSLVPQRAHGVEAEGTAGREVCGNERDYDQQPGERDQNRETHRNNSKDKCG